VVRTTYSLPEAWTDEQVLAWFEAVAALPQGTEVSKDGVFFADPTRAQRLGDLFSWSSAELFMALKGELTDVNDNKLSAVIKELRKRTDEIDAAWSFQQVLDYYRQGVTPAKTSTDVWVTDQTRMERNAASWTTAELEAWAKGEIKPTSKAPDNKLAVELKQRLALNPKSNSPADVIVSYKQATVNTVKTSDSAATLTKAAVENTSSTTNASIKGLTTMNLSFIDGAFERYAAAVKPGKMITEAEGKTATTQLENMFQYVIKLEDPQAMVSGLERIKNVFVKEREGLFSPSNAHRFDHLLRKEGNFAERHTDFVEAMMIHASPNKEMRKQCDVRLLLNKQPAEKIDQLVEYFNTIA